MNNSFNDGYPETEASELRHPGDQFRQDKQPYSAELKTVVHSPLSNKKTIVGVLLITLFSVAFSFSLVDSYSPAKTIQLIILMMPVFVVIYFSFAQNETHQQFKKLDEKYAAIHQYIDQINIKRGS